MHLANRPTIPEIVPPSGLRLVAPLPMAAERIRQRARHPVQAVPLAVDGEPFPDALGPYARHVGEPRRSASLRHLAALEADTLSERDEREQYAIADGVEGILP